MSSRIRDNGQRIDHDSPLATVIQPVLRPQMPELDSLRGIACLMVLFYHGFANHFEADRFSLLPRLLIRATSLGWTGVNLFFVLSGLLITGILIDSRGSSDYYRHFYIRRALRILPLYYGVLLLLALFWQLRLSDRAMSWTFLGMAGIYLANMTPLIGLSIQYPVVWSLAVEEHFYLLWPACIRRLSLRGIAVFAVVICIATLALRILASALHYEPLGLYTWLVTDGLAMGALLAVVARRFSRSQLWAFAGCAVLITAICFAIDSLAGQTLAGGALHVTGFNAFFAAILTLALLLGSKFSVRSRILEFVGAISYGVYLTHFLFFDVFDHFGKRVWPSLAERNVGFPLVLFRFLTVATVTIVVCYLSRWYFEEPFLRLKSRFAPSDSSRRVEASLPTPMSAEGLSERSIAV